MDSKLLKSLVKKQTDGTSTNRLQSLKIPRDLTLGGTKPKKIFMPNVNVVRNKDKTKELVKTLDRKRKDRVKNEPRNKSFGNGGRFIQSTGVFSDGAAEQRRSGGGYSERTSYSKSENDPSNGISVPTYKKCDLIVDKQKEDVVLDELINHDYEMDEEKLPFVPIAWKNEIKTEVKTEPIENGNFNDIGIPTGVPFFHKGDENHPRLALFKLPDSFAGKGLSDDPNVKKIFDYPLKVMLEGKIGTLQVKRSGKMYIKIGHVKYLLESIDSFSSNESVTTFSESITEQHKPQFAVLGNIEQKFIMNPIWKSLFDS